MSSLNGPDGRVLEQLGRGEVGEPLRQVEGVVLPRQAGHAADHRLAESVGAAGRAHERSGERCLKTNALARSLPYPPDMAPAPAFTDLHSHLVPAVDDGSASAEESRDSLARLRREGVGTVVTTPHLLLPHLTSDAALDRELDAPPGRLRPPAGGACEGASDLPAVGLGQEIWAPDAALLRRVASRPDVGLAGSRWLLVEFGFDLQGTHEGVVREAIVVGARHRDRPPRALPLPARCRPGDPDASVAGAGRGAAGERGELHRPLPVIEPRLGAPGLGDGRRRDWSIW